MTHVFKKSKYSNEPSVDNDNNNNDNYWYYYYYSKNSYHSAAQIKNPKHKIAPNMLNDTLSFHNNRCNLETKTIILNPSSFPLFSKSQIHHKMRGGEEILVFKVTVNSKESGSFTTKALPNFERQI